MSESVHDSAKNESKAIKKNPLVRKHLARKYGTFLDFLLDFWDLLA